MKFYKEEISGADKPRYLFAVGTDEMKLIKSLLEHAIEHIPQDFFPDSIKRNRIKTMLNEFDKSILDTNTNKIPKDTHKDCISKEDVEIEIQKILEPYFIQHDGGNYDDQNELIIKISIDIAKLLSKPKEDKE